LQPFRAQIESIVANALAEDLGGGDVTTEALIPPTLQGKASIMAKASGILAGMEVMRMVFQKLDPSLQVNLLVPDGARLKPGKVVATIEGNVSNILKGERVALNFLQRLSGIASETARYVEAVSGSAARILDTRKTTPGLRALEKYAVRVGGGHNHRYNLGDGILIKDNHLAGLRSQGSSLKDIVLRAQQSAPHSLKIEVEVSTLAEALEAVDAGTDIILLDNMSVEEMRAVVDKVKGRALVEASGGITLDNVKPIAEAGVNLISVGRLTHSAKALDISLELESLFSATT
jgi:nicotinate-nucleotide pyrophosphorylase (carboxylating)